MNFFRRQFFYFGAIIGLAGCARKNEVVAPSRPGGGLRKISLQTDWFPQGEHGGFYQALAKGFYREAGLDVTLLPGGPGAGIKPKVAKGEADFGMNRSDDLILAASRGLPLTMVAAVLQHDPQGLLVHEDSPVKTFADLNGRTVTAAVGMAWIPWVKKKMGIDFSLRPLNYGLAGFLADKEAMQQGFLTNEPYLAREKGVRVRVLAIADTGFDAYHVIFCRRELARTEPALVRAFVAASARGWRDYLDGDPTPAHALILQRNPQMSAGLLEFSRGELIARRLVSGDAARGEDIGQLALARVTQQIEMLRELKILETALRAQDVATEEFLPERRR